MGFLEEIYGYILYLSNLTSTLPNLLFSRVGQSRNSIYGYAIFELAANQSRRWLDILKRAAVQVETAGPANDGD